MKQKLPSWVTDFIPLVAWHHSVYNIDTHTLNRDAFDTFKANLTMLGCRTRTFDNQTREELEGAVYWFRSEAMTPWGWMMRETDDRITLDVNELRKMYLHYGGC